MSESKVYSARTVFEGLKRTFHQYLEAQYHIWDEGLIAERQRLLDRPGVSFQEPKLEATPFYVSGKPIVSCQFLGLRMRFSRLLQEGQMLAFILSPTSIRQRRSKHVLAATKR